MALVLALIGFQRIELLFQTIGELANVDLLMLHSIARVKSCPSFKDMLKRFLGSENND